MNVGAGESVPPCRTGRLALVWAALGAGLVAWLIPAEAHACPTCALGQSDGWGRDALVAGMMAAPFAIAVVAGRAIARIASGCEPGQAAAEEAVGGADDGGRAATIAGEGDER